MIAKGIASEKHRGVHVAVLRANASASPDASAGVITRREARLGRRRNPLRRLGRS